MRARVEREAERPDLAHDRAGAGRTLDDVDLRGGDAGRTAEGGRRAAAEDARPRALRDARGVERVVEVRVAEDDGVGARELRREEALVRSQREEQAAREGGTRQVRVEEDDVRAARDLEARRPEPPHRDGAGLCRERVLAEGDLVRVHACSAPVTRGASSVHPPGSVC